MQKKMLGSLCCTRLPSGLEERTIVVELRLKDDDGKMRCSPSPQKHRWWLVGGGGPPPPIPLFAQIAHLGCAIFSLSLVVCVLSQCQSFGTAPFGGVVGRVISLSLFLVLLSQVFSHWPAVVLPATLRCAPPASP